MNKQDKKEIMNLIKYKKMLGGRRMKLIDILNKIANGELKEDYRTEIKMNGLYYRLYARQTADNLLTDLFIHLNDEVELIEPEETKECEHEWSKYTLGEIGTEGVEHKHRRMCKICGMDEEEPTDNTKIEELNVKGLCEIFEGKHTVNPNLAFSTALNKINEIIRYINK